MDTIFSTGDTLSLTITDLGIHGEGIGHAKGLTIFVPQALPEETVTATIQTVKKSYAVATLNTIEEASPHRVIPDCPVYDTCGGCQISHLTYEAQCAIKERQVRAIMERISGIDGSVVQPLLPAKHAFRYRNKSAAPIGQNQGKPIVGYYRQGTHDITPVNTCLIQQEIGDRLFRFTKDFLTKYNLSTYNEKTGKGIFRHIMGRVGDKGKLMAILITATDELPRKEEWIQEIRQAIPEIVSLYHNVQKRKGNAILGPTVHHLWGEKTLTATLCGLTFSISPHSFFQIHRSQAETLYEKALELAHLHGEETVIDAYCGTGTISLCLAQKAKKVIGIEIVSPAIEDAKKNAQRNHIENADFLVGDAARLMPRLYEEGLRPDVIVMDPVRAGCDERVLHAAAAMNPKRIVYVSCHPATFARDAKRLAQEGYTVRSVTPVDMFPQTMHVETVSLLSKENST